jgi:hypothetical protein
MSDDGGLIPPHGNYRELLSYRKAEIVYDVTYRFCQRFCLSWIARSIRSIQGALENRTLSRPVRPLGLPRRRKSSCSALPGQASKNCRTTGTSFGCASSRSGKRRAVRPNMSGGLERVPRTHDSGEASIQKGRQKRMGMGLMRPMGLMRRIARVTVTNLSAPLA